MTIAVHRHAIRYQADANARADGYVGEIGQRLPGAPPQFCERRAVYVRVECRANSKALLQSAGDVGAGPSLLRRRRDEPPGRRGAIEVDRTEAGDAKRADRLFRMPSRKNGFDCADSSLGLGRIDKLLVDHIIVRAREHADAFRAAEFDAGVNRAAHAFCIVSADAAQHCWMKRSCGGSWSSCCRIAERMRESVRFKSSSDMAFASGWYPR